MSSDGSTERSRENLRPRAVWSPSWQRVWRGQRKSQMCKADRKLRAYIVPRGDFRFVQDLQAFEFELRDGWVLVAQAGRHCGTHLRFLELS